MSTTAEIPTAPSVGEMLKARIKKRKIYKSALARHLKRSPVSIQNYTKNPSMQTALLWQISLALKHNFFADMADQMPKEFTTEVIPDTTKDDRIAALELEVTILTKQLEVLKEVMRG